MRAAATLAAWAALAAFGCGDDDVGLVLKGVSIEPAGTVAACSPVTLHVELSGLARYSVVADGTLLATGLLYAGEQTIELGALPEPMGGRDTTTLAVTAVGSSGKTERRQIPIPRSQNSAPHANAGPTRRTNAGEAIVLDGSGSRDPDGDVLGYTWAIVTGEASLEGADGARVTVTVAQPGAAELELVARDPAGAEGRTRVLVRAVDAGGPPAFVEASDTVVLQADPGETVEIDATATSPGEAEVRYRFFQTAGPAATLSPNGARATVRAPASEGLVTIEAVADNGFGDVRKRVSVRVGKDTLEDAPPTPEIEAPSAAPVLAEIVLDGSASSDAERSDLGYLWSVEEAPEGSQLSASSIPGNGTPGAVRPIVMLDREGTYRFRLRAVDAVGPSPATAEVIVSATSDAEVAEVGPVRDIAVDGSGRAIASLAEGGVVLENGSGEDVIDAEPAGAVVYSDEEGVFYYARQAGGPAELVAVAPSTGTEVAAQLLPADGGEEPPADVRAIAVSPEGVNAGDLVLATNAGFVILDVSDASEEQEVGRPLQIGGDFVHRPPSYTPGPESALSDEERDALSAAQLTRGGELAVIGARPSVQTAGTIEVLSGNPFWMVSMDYPQDRNFVTRTYDPLGDDLPNAVLALGVGPDTEVVMLEALGVVWRGGDGGADCMLSLSGDSPRCPAPPADACAVGPSDPPPADALDVVASSSGRFWIASSDGVRRFDPETGRFVRLAAPGAGPAHAIDVRSGVVVIGTEAGVWRVGVGSGE
jgi:hypothetical protein